MQQTRRYILEILRDRGEATVDELVNELKARIQHNITAVTVRHHLDILRSDNLVTAPSVRRSGAPGRPQYVYSLTDKALDTFPNNYQQVMGALVEQLKETLGAPQVNVIFEGVADRMLSEVQKTNPSLHLIPIADRLDHAVQYLNGNGYEAQWEQADGGFILRTRNCPYQKVSHEHGELCSMDMRLIAGLLGVVPRNLGRIAQDEDTCTYLIPVREEAAAS
jgi:DeoR family suf operon transcriptional repressor